MNPKRLLSLYDRISEAPDAVARLRRFVLDLAVRGKLVEQDPGDEPIAELLERVAEQRARLLKAVGIRRRSAQEPKMVEPAHELPSAWRWVPLGSIFLYDAGAKREPKSLDPSRWLLELEDIEKETGRLMARVAVADRESKSTKSEFQVGDVLYGKLRPYLTKVLVADEPGYSTTEIVAIRSFAPLCSEYCALALRAPSFVGYVTRLGQGTKMPRLRSEDAVVSAFPLPPVAEQHRIVAKVDELMALCDQLEEARTQREALRERLTTASLARLAAPDTDAETFKSHARFALDALPALTARPDQIKALRQTILNLAVRGKLVEPDSGGEPASVLLERMVDERKAIVARRKIKGAKPPASPSAETEGFDLPSTWRLCSLGQITLVTDPNPSHRYPDYSGGTVPILSTREFAGDDGWNPETAKLTSESFWEVQKEICDFADGDIIFARKGRLGLPRFLPSFEKFTFSHTLFAIKPMTGLDPAYLLWLLRRQQVLDWLIKEMNQNTGVPTLGKAKIERLPIPLPPIAEQHRIIAKVDELMALCDKLEAGLATGEDIRGRLLDAVLAEALAGDAENRGARDEALVSAV